MRTKFKMKIYSVIAVLAMASVLVTSIPVEAQELREGSNSVSDLVTNSQVFSESIDISKEIIEEEQQGYEIKVSCRDGHYPTDWICGGTYNKCYKYKKCNACHNIVQEEKHDKHDYKSITIVKPT